MASLIEGLGLAGKGVVSLVGAGGKTSLLFRLAAELAAVRGPVLTTTTTKIYPPTDDQCAQVIVSPSRAFLKEARPMLKRHPHITAAAACDPASGKLTGYAPDDVDRINDTRLFPWIIVEADGAAGKPLKAPAPHEPVLPSSTTTVIGIAGLSALGAPLDDRFVFRACRFSRITNLPVGEAVSVEALCALITHPQGLFKDAPDHARQIVFLNQADLPGRSRIARDVLDRLTGNPPSRLTRLLVGSLKLETPVYETVDFFRR